MRRCLPLSQTVRPITQPAVRRLEQASSNAYARHTVAALYPIAGGALGGMKPAHVSLLHVARQMAAAPQVEQPERWLFWWVSCGGGGGLPALAGARCEQASCRAAPVLPRYLVITAVAL